jgi:hypothetical protein
VVLFTGALRALELLEEVAALRADVDRQPPRPTMLDWPG